MNPDYLSDDEFCRYADTDNPWIKSAVERIENFIDEIATKDATINAAYRNLEDIIDSATRAQNEIDNEG